MKKHSTSIRNVIATLSFFGIFGFANAQNSKLAVMPMDSKGIVLDATQLGNLLRIEVEKTNLYKVMDNYEIQSIALKNNIKLNECFAKSCLVEVGTALHSEKIMGGSVERYGEKIILTIRLIDVQTGNIDKTQVDEFLNLQPEIQSMIAVSVKNMLGIKNDPEMVKRISKANNYESSINNPGEKQLSLSGPRMGLTFVTGHAGDRLTAAKDQGGYNAFPVMTQFGYQFETQYLNSGNFQALLEFLPLVTGIDQGYFIPSVTILNGFRNNANGWEFAFGPAFGFVRMSEGYYENGEWHLKEDWKKLDASNNITANPYKIEDNIDKRGTPIFTSGFVFAIGKTFKSGDLNIPVNAYVIPSNEGLRVGMSFGFNTKR